MYTGVSDFVKALSLKSNIRLSPLSAPALENIELRFVTFEIFHLLKSAAPVSFLQYANMLDMSSTLLTFHLLNPLISVSLSKSEPLISWLNMPLMFLTLPTFHFSRLLRLLKLVQSLNMLLMSVTLRTFQSLNALISANPFIPIGLGSSPEP